MQTQDTPGNSTNHRETERTTTQNDLEDWDFRKIITMSQFSKEFGGETKGQTKFLKAGGFPTNTRHSWKLHQLI